MTIDTGFTSVKVISDCKFCLWLWTKESIERKKDKYTGKQWEEYWLLNRKTKSNILIQDNYGDFFYKERKTHRYKKRIDIQFDRQVGMYKKD